MTLPRMYFHPDDLSSAEKAFKVQRAERLNQLLDGPAGRETLAALLAHPGVDLNVTEIATHTAQSTSRIQVALDRAALLDYVVVTPSSGGRYRRYRLSDTGTEYARQLDARDRDVTS